MVRVTVLGLVVELLMVKAGIEFAFPEEGSTVTPVGTVVALQEKVVPLSAVSGNAVVAEPEQIVCVDGFKIPSVGAVPIAKVSVLVAELAQPPTVEINSETVLVPPLE